jgi:hypothetical protein
MRRGRAAERSPPGEKRIAGMVVKPLQREAAHLTRRDGCRRRLIDHGDGVTIEEADITGLPARTLTIITHH